jgi:RND superfamily putative drug exporter
MVLDLSTEGFARRSSRRPWTTILVWVGVLFAAFALNATLLEDGLTTEFVFMNDPDSKVGFDLLEDRLRGTAGTNEMVIFQSESFTVSDPVYRETVEVLIEDLAALGPGIIRPETLLSYYQTGAEPLVSQDRHTTIVPLTMAGDFDDASDNIDSVVDVVRGYRGQGDVKVLMTGQATVGRDFREVADEALRTGEMFGVPIALVILVLVFGAVAAALVPLVLAGISILVALGAAALLGQVFQLSFFVTNMITMIGLAVGIDYSLFVVARYREERTNGLEKAEAIARAGATATRAVFFSGMTVVLALLGLLLVPSNIMISLGVGASFVVIASVMASMTLLPAVLSLVGDRVNSLSIPWFGRARAGGDETRPGGFWDRISRGVMRQPVVSLLLAGGLLAVAAASFFDMNTGFAGVSDMPDGLESKEAFLILDAEFSAGEVTPAEIVIDGDIDSPSVQAGIQELQTLLAGDGAFGSPRPLDVNGAGDLALLSVPVAGDSVSDEAQEAIRRLRRDHVPAAFAGVLANVYVTGETAMNLDFFDIAKDSAPVVFTFVLGISLLLLTLVFRSIVVPLKAITLNLLSVGAAYGILVMVFQKGWLNDAFGFKQVDTIEAWLPLFLFAVLFGLSMDYHVFLLSRIRERYDATLDNTGSVAFGIRTTGRLITGAALIMVAVFLAFASGDLVMLQQMGFGLGTAVLLDATIIRVVLVPASMKLLGKWNWYLPRWLEWMPDLRVEPAKSAAVPAGADND